MRELLAALRREDGGQGMTEWALILAFVVLGSAALMNSSGSAVSGIWTTANATLQGQSQTNTPATSGGGNTGGDTSGNNGGDNGDGGDHHHDH